MYMWHLGTWFSGGLGCVRFVFDQDDLEGLFQPKLLYDHSICVLVKELVIS